MNPIEALLRYDTVLPMITIKSAGLRYGYSGYDHLITGEECSDIIGRRFRSVGEARRTARRLVNRNADRRVTIAPISLDIILPNGSETTV